MTEPAGWKNFFDRHAPKYMENVFTKNTLPEVEFLLEELSLPSGSAILDVGCGTGRHSVELAKRGYQMTGVDLSTGMLEQARRAAEAAGVELELIECDATRMTLGRSFDAVICLCEGSFGLIGLEEDPVEHDLAILRSIHNALKPGGKLIMNALNGLAKVRQYNKEDIAAGTFDPLTLVETFTLESDTVDGTVTITARERGYVPSELSLMLRLTGFEVDHIWGSTAGNWRREQIDPDEIEFMVIAHRKA
ncbi:MAG: methyltransferase domain-containing protein [candidate division Zixibacteria bacterium]|nr:methyltransferase domain-containing protein [candidate division Zixibacteria bacterium]